MEMETYVGSTTLWLLVAGALVMFVMLLARRHAAGRSADARSDGAIDGADASAGSQFMSGSTDCGPVDSGGSSGDCGGSH